MESFGDAPTSIFNRGGHRKRPRTIPPPPPDEDANPFDAALNALHAAEAAAAHEDGQEAEPPERFRKHPVKSRRLERAEFAKVTPIEECFFCHYVGERNTAIKSQKVERLVQFLRKNVGRMQQRYLAKQLFRLYDDLRTEKNANLRPGEAPLPLMSAGLILLHLRTHHHDPQVKIAFGLDQCQELREFAFERIFEKGDRTGQVRVNREMLHLYKEAWKLELQLQKVDPQKMLFYSADGMMDAATMKTGAIATSNKDLRDYWKK